MNDRQLLDEFVKHPAMFTDFLIAQHKLRGQFRDMLARFLLSHSDLPWTADYLWILLLPRILSVVCTDGCCNLRCRMCNGGQGKLAYLHAAEFAQILDHAPTAELVIFVAGDSEPLMNPEFPDLLRIVDEHCANANIVTNGHLLSDRLIETMIHSGQPFALNVSLDAALPATYRAIRGADLEQVLERLRRFTAARDTAGRAAPQLSLLMVGMEDNIVELPRFVELAMELGAFRVHVDHMNGEFTPGDFMKNPCWKTALREALCIGRELGIDVQVPHDALQQLNADEQASGNNGAESCVDRQPEPTHTQCPWLHYVHIELDGRLRPCCNMPTFIGNIHDGPLRENLEYLKTRLGNMSGKIHRVCMTAKNCAYVQEIKRCGIKPIFLD